MVPVCQGLFYELSRSIYLIFLPYIKLQNTVELQSLVKCAFLLDEFSYLIIKHLDLSARYM